MKFLVLSALIAVASALPFTFDAAQTFRNDDARAADIIFGRGDLSRASDINIHPLSFYKVGIQASGLPFELVGHANGAVVPAEPTALLEARAAIAARHAEIRAAKEAERLARAAAYAKELKVRADAIARIHAAQAAALERLRTK